MGSGARQRRARADRQGHPAILCPAPKAEVQREHDPKEGGGVEEALATAVSGPRVTLELRGTLDTTSPGSGSADSLTLQYPPSYSESSQYE